MAAHVPGAQLGTDSQSGAGAGDGPWLADPFLELRAGVVTDLESVRIACENRLTAMTLPPEKGGWGLMPPGCPDLAALLRIVRDELRQPRPSPPAGFIPDVWDLAVQVRRLREVEDGAVADLKKRMRAHPLGAWVSALPGVGEKQCARLLAATGDPFWHGAEGRPRMLRELRQYCGHGAVVARRRGVRATWNPEAKSRVRLIAVSAVRLTGQTDKAGRLRARSPFRDSYDAARAKYAGAIHEDECPPCGPAGSPATPGSPLSDQHQHQRALRQAGKDFIDALWREAKRLHESAGGAA